MFVMSGCSVIWPGLVWCGIVDATAGDDSTGADDIDGTVDGAGAGMVMIELLSVMSQCSTI